jgi:peptidyl-prolyl cis-trans isomerase D
MLQKLRDQTQSFAFKVLVGVIIFVLAIFGFGAFNLFLTTDPTVASVNGEDITLDLVAVEVERERRRMAAQFGENFDPNLIDPAALQTSVVNQLISRALLSQASKDLGIGASDKQVNEIVVGNPSFQIDGQFEENAYRRVVGMLGYTPSEFLDLTGDMLGIEQLRNGITESSFRTGWELRTHARLLSQRRDIAFLAFNEETFADKVEVSDEDVVLRYQENQLDYMTEENVDLEYVELTLDSLIEADAEPITEEDLIATYEADKASAGIEEQRDSRHILLQVNEQRSADDARIEIAALKARIDAGEEFAALAREYSEDPGSAADGGELGPVGEGLFAPEFEEALWALEPGQISEPVITDFGVHLIQLNEVIVNEYPEFDALKDQIAERMRRDASERRFVDVVRELDNLAFEQPESLQGLSDQLGLEIKSAAGVSRSAGGGIFGNVTLRQRVFTDEVLEQGYNSPAIEYLENRAVVARVTARHAPQPIPLEEVRDEIRAEIVSERARLEIDQAHALALERVESGEAVSEVADDFGLQWQTHELVRRNEPGIPGEVLSTSFSLPRVLPGEKQVGSASAADGARYVVTVTRVEDGDLSTMTETEIAGVEQFLVMRGSNLDFEGYYSALEQDASIRRLE